MPFFQQIFNPPSSSCEQLAAKTFTSQSSTNQLPTLVVFLIFSFFCLLFQSIFILLVIRVSMVKAIWVFIIRLFRIFLVELLIAYCFIFIIMAFFMAILVELNQNKMVISFSFMLAWILQLIFVSDHCLDFIRSWSYFFLVESYQ